MDSVVEKCLLDPYFDYSQPFFYGNPLALRCELGRGDTEEEYLAAAKERAMIIYRLLFPKEPDAMVFDFYHCEFCNSGPAEAESRPGEDLDEICQDNIDFFTQQIRFLHRAQKNYRHTTVRALKTMEMLDDEELVARINRVICYADGKRFGAEQMIRARIELCEDSLASFVSFDGEVILSVYDDRGCDVVFFTPEAFIANYPRLEPYFLDHDREKMARRLEDAKGAIQ